MDKLKVSGKEFRLFIPAEKIDKEIKSIAEQMNKDLVGKKPIFLSVLNGAFMFTSDLLKNITVEDSEVSFIKLASYEGMHSSGKVSEVIGLNIDIENRCLVILEDMLDSGRSMSYLLDILKSKNPSEIKLAVMFYKPNALKFNVHMDYKAIALENDFVLGRGLDYNGIGRNYPDLYIINE